MDIHGAGVLHQRMYYNDTGELSVHSGCRLACGNTVQSVELLDVVYNVHTAPSCTSGVRRGRWCQCL